MMSKLTALDVRCLLADLDLAIQYRDDADTHARCIASIRDTLLRAALADVAVEQIDLFDHRRLAA